jgi:hypothetical protein
VKNKNRLTWAILGALAVVFLMFFGCAGSMPAEKSVCATDQAATGSVICRIASEMGWTVEEVDNAILDATVLSWAFDVAEKEQILSLCEKVETVVNAEVDIQMSRIVALVVEDSKKSMAIASILSRRLIYFDVPEVITPYDRYLILTNLKHVRDQFAIFE